MQMRGTEDRSRLADATLHAPPLRFAHGAPDKLNKDV